MHVSPLITWFPLPSQCLCSVTACVQISPLDKDTIHLRSRPPLMSSCQLNYLFKESVPKYSHMLRYWQL